MGDIMPIGDLAALKKGQSFISRDDFLLIHIKQEVGLVLDED